MPNKYWGATEFLDVFPLFGVLIIMKQVVIIKLLMPIMMNKPQLWHWQVMKQQGVQLLNTDHMISTNAWNNVGWNKLVQWKWTTLWNQTFWQMEQIINIKTKLWNFIEKTKKCNCVIVVIVFSSLMGDSMLLTLVGK